MLDIASIRKDFPILGQSINGRPLVYLDNAATTQKPRQVIGALTEYYETSNANIHRGIHTLAVRATEQYEAAREKTARFIGAPRTADIVFTRNTTESINLVARAWGDANVEEGDEIVLSLMEHHSNIVPWQLLCQRTGAQLRFAHVTDDGQLDLANLRSLLGPRTKLVSITHISNVLGTINPIAEIARMAHGAGALMLVDGAQSVPQIGINVAELGADFFAFSAHKMYGPTGVGVLWAREGILEAMDPFLGGGDMISVVREEDSTWADLPHKFEAGTPNIADVIAFGAAIDYLTCLGMEKVREHEQSLVRYTFEQLPSVPGLHVLGPGRAEASGGAISFVIDGVHPHDVATIADGFGVAVRAGHHCAQPLMRRLGVSSTSRASFGLYNEQREIDVLVEALRRATEVFS